MSDSNSNCAIESLTPNDYGTMAAVEQVKELWKNPAANAKKTRIRGSPSIGISEAPFGQPQEDGRE